MSKKTKVTISLLSYNGERYLPWLLQSIKQQTFSDWELLVMDNASADNSVKVVREYYPEARIVTQKRNLGFAKGHNLLINWSDSDYVFVLNQDVILDSNYLKTLVDYLDKNDQVASVAGKLMYWNFEEGKKTDQIDSFGLKINRQRQASDLYQGQSDFAQENQEVFGLSATATLYRRKSLDIVAYSSSDNHQEYFDEDFFSYKEDVDLAWRLRLLGWKNYLLTSTCAYHHRSVSSLNGLKARRQHRVMANKLSYRNHLLVIYKNSFAKNLRQDFFYIKWYEFKKFIYLLIFERSTLAGIKEYFKLLPKMRKKRAYIMKQRKVNPEDMAKWFK